MRPTRIALGAIALLLAGCRSPLAHTVRTQDLAGRAGATLVDHADLPAARGNEGCGSQALAVALARFDPSLEPQALSDSLPWHDRGATVVDLIVEARKRGYRVSLHKGTLGLVRAAVQAGHVALVLLDVQTEVWTLAGWTPSRTRMHWGVVGGVVEGRAPSKGQVVLAGRRGTSYLVEEALFEARWSKSGRCMVVVEGQGPAAPAGR